MWVSLDEANVWISTCVHEYDQTHVCSEHWHPVNMARVLLVGVGAVGEAFAVLANRKTDSAWFELMVWSI